MCPPIQTSDYAVGPSVGRFPVRLWTPLDTGCGLFEHCRGKEKRGDHRILAGGKLSLGRDRNDITQDQNDDQKEDVCDVELASVLWR